ncbi:translation elongation factor Ts [Candidatus Liberibacter sp.]|uniref:translation elongation factor Ts n=1 Tax=Candidatus Liberibacter sp. TaxID=34022 RepID=UPI0015F71C51|nr:translation elongation factor Ts [Candidatus Liberibacter sp.]MBA5724451.1 elongation factor Ts [Candidatus Liberibacter sp.]
MSEISILKVKELREKTSAGFGDCKSALTEANGDMDLAIELLKAKGMSRAQKKTGREASEGLIGVSHDGYGKASVVEVNSETDYVARSSDFQDIVRKIAKIALSTDGSVEEVLSAPFDDTGIVVKDGIKAGIAIIGENISLRRSSVLSVGEGVVSSYVHAAISEGIGKIGVLVALKSSGDKEKLSSIGVQIAMHVAASSPLAISSQRLDSSIVDRRRAIYVEEVRDSGKPENLVERIVEGKMQKFFKEVVLLSQDFVMNTDQTVFDFLKDSEKEIHASIEIVGVVHFAR